MSVDPTGIDSGISAAQAAELRRAYCDQGLSFRNAAALAGCSEWRAYRYLRREALIREKPRRSLREDAFRGSDPHTNYWLGYLVADGCCHTHTHCISLIQSGERRVQVSKFRAWLGSDHTISEYTNAWGNPVAALAVFSRTMKADLAALGVHPRKTYRNDRIDPRVAASPSFWLGLLDGDGWVSAPGRRSPGVKFLGTHAVLTQCREHMQAALGVVARVRVAKRRANGSASLHLLEFRGAAAQAVLRHVYSEVPESVVLPYKRERARHILDWSPVSRRKFDMTTELAIVRQYLDDPRVAALARLYGCSDNVITSIIDRHDVERRHERKPRKPLDRSQDDQVIEHYLGPDGSLPSTGRRFGISQWSVAKILEEHGIARRPPGSPGHRASRARVEPNAGVRTMLGDCQEGVS